MITYLGRCRSNYFRLRDADAAARFRELCERYGLQLLEGGSADSSQPAGYFAFLSDEGGPNKGSFPSGYSDGKGEWVDGDLIDELAPLLADGSICVVMEAGHEEKLRYLTGFALAFSNGCDPARAAPDAVLTIHLDDILGLARERWGGEVTSASY